MKVHLPLAGRVRPALLGLFLLAAAAPAAAELLALQTSNGASSYTAFDPADPAAPGAEAADDFEVIGSVERVQVRGYMPNFNLQGFRGVTVRFYAATANGPGALLQEQFLAAGNPRLLYEPTRAEWFDITLPVAFNASGRHFISVQVAAEGWNWVSAAPYGSTVYVRDAAGNWVQPSSPFISVSMAYDLSFALHGRLSGPGRIDALSGSAAPRSGYFEVRGANFGESGQLLVGGLPAPIAHWTPRRVIAYVPEGAALASQAVSLTTAGGDSNQASLTVGARVADGRIRWKMRLDAPQARVRPVVGGDGSLYAVDINDHLYALSPDGALRWIAQGSGNRAVAVGADGTVYTASELAVKAYTPAGAVKWVHLFSKPALALVGLSVGPDGNLYGVATEGLGVFSLTPAGALRWQTPEPYSRLNVTQGEVVFGAAGRNATQMYFGANDHLRGLDLGGKAVFTLSGATQPAISPLDGTLHITGTAFASDGRLLWTYAFPYAAPVSVPDVGPDGIHYTVHASSNVYALNPNGTKRWSLAVADLLDAPVVAPDNRSVVLKGRASDGSGIVAGVSTGGALQWRLALPADGSDKPFVDTKARFAPDASTVYVVGAVSSSDPAQSRSFLYAIDTAAGAPAAGGGTTTRGGATGGGGRGGGKKKP